MTAALTSVQLLPPTLPRRRRVQQALPMQASFGARLAAPRWLFIAGGAALGAMMLGLPGALLGALGGYLLTR